MRWYSEEERQRTASLWQGQNYSQGWQGPRNDWSTRVSWLARRSDIRYHYRGKSSSIAEYLSRNPITNLLTLLSRGWAEHANSALAHQTVSAKQCPNWHLLTVAAQSLAPSGVERRQQYPGNGRLPAPSSCCRSTTTRRRIGDSCSATWPQRSSGSSRPISRRGHCARRGALPRGLRRAHQSCVAVLVAELVRRPVTVIVAANQAALLAAKAAHNR